jgi:hypothetical protein
MSEEKKDKPQVDVRDLKPNKDAKGGGGGHAAQGGGKTAQGGGKINQKSVTSVARRSQPAVRPGIFRFSSNKDFPQQEVVAMPRAARAGVDPAARLIFLSTITWTIRF